MSTTINSDCTEILITSDFIQELTDDPELDLTLTVTHNCETEYTVTITPEDDTFTLTPTDLSMEETFEDGTYRFLLTKTDSGVTYEVGCNFAGCSLKCDLITYLSNNLDSNILHLYEALTFTSTCADCDCEEACAIYTEILDRLTKDTRSACDNC